MSLGTVHLITFCDYSICVLGTRLNSVEKNVSNYFAFSPHPKSTHYNKLKFEMVRFPVLTFQEVIRVRELYQ